MTNSVMPMAVRGYQAKPKRRNTMLRRFRKWKAEKKRKQEADRYREGFNFAAGTLLRGETTPKEIELLMPEYPLDPFDKGVECAISQLVSLNVIKDDRF